MKEFIELRRKARENCDRAINLARRDYAETLVRIAALEQDLLGRVVSTHRSICSCIERVIPTDRELTTPGIMTALEALVGGRVWRGKSGQKRPTAAMMAGIAGHVWSFDELFEGLKVRIEVAHKWRSTE